MRVVIWLSLGSEFEDDEEEDDYEEEQEGESRLSNVQDGGFAYQKYGLIFRVR